MSVLTVHCHTEDGARDAPDVLLALFRRFAQLSVEGCQTHRIEPVQMGSELRQSMVANLWKGDERRQRALARSIATALRMGECVAIHVDADCLWGERSINAAQLEENVIGLVRAHLPEWESLADRLILILPHYSMESWCYLNRTHVRTLVEEGRVSRAALQALDEMGGEEGGFDHIPQIKDRCELGSAFNRTLIENGFPYEDAYLTSPSFAAVSDRLEASAWIMNALKATLTPYSP